MRVNPSSLASGASAPAAPGTLKLGKDAQDALAELARLYTIEAVQRAARVATMRAARERPRSTDPTTGSGINSGVVDVQIGDLEVVLPQLMLDFS
ncbi:hypothetical protein BC828DRAFT_387499 [Blastocladiella britannica]|nr:hypothetical protein BC828DRAFT_387499 [Blastocladiella britannica]